MKFSRPERGELVGLSAAVIALHVVGWTLAWVAARQHPFMLGLAGLAYSFGLRHAFDADHIAAIDNTTRALMGGDRRPLGVGFFFSLGHSTVVFGLTLAIAVAARAVTTELPTLRAAGAALGTTIAGLFLYAIGLVNILVMVDILRVLRTMRQGGADPHALDEALARRGFLNRWLSGLYRIVRRPRQMYWLGLLFGLGFDTATEIALLTTAGVAASQALPLASVLSLPIVFAAGMSLFDSADGVLMCGAYAWALDHPLRKIFYNLTITGLSVVVALFVGSIELVSIVTDQMLGWHNGIWGFVQQLDLQTMGVAVAGLFILSWMAALAVWHLGGFEQRWSRQ